MAIPSYLTDQQIRTYLTGTDSLADSTVQTTISKIMSTTTNGIEALPYQFMESVDRRIPNTDVGRKYGDRIFSRLPLLFLTPCEPLFMDDFNKQNKNIVAQSLMGGINGYGDLLSQSGRYYSTSFAYTDYYDYLNTMLTCVSVYLGIHNEKINVNGKMRKICEIDWASELNDDFKTFFSSEENIIFYLDGLNSVSEGFSNDTTESSLASTINGFSEQANEIRFLFGSGGNVAANLINSADEISSNVTENLSNMATSLGGGIIGSLTGKGVNAVLDGGKISFPKIWNNSNYEKSYSIDIKLRSPDHDPLSIFLNILKPYCKLLCLVMSKQIVGDANGYSSPFLVKAYSKGLFNVDMGIISSLSVTKGAECQWNDDGLPTQIDISVTIDDLYSTLSMSSMHLSANTIFGRLSPTQQGKDAADLLINNTAYLDFLANNAGLNIGQMEIGRRITMFYYLSKMDSMTLGSSTFRIFDQGVSRLINRIYNRV